VVRDVAVDQPLRYDDVELDEGSTILQLRRLQDQLLRR
jgi:predicted homoserine dehydrogenase-like protein